VLPPNGAADESPPEPNGAPGVLGFPKGEDELKDPAGVLPKGAGAVEALLAPNGELVLIAPPLDAKGDGAGAALLKLAGGADGALDPVCVAASVLSNGLGTLYFAPNFLNISCSRPW
jgi:hypothetical protein